MYVNPFGLGVFVGVVGTVAFCIVSVICLVIWDSKRNNHDQ